MWHKPSFTQFWSQSDAYSRRSSLKLTYIHHPLVVCTHQICCAVAVPIALSQDRLLHGHNRLVNWTPCSRMREQANKAEIIFGKGSANTSWHYQVTEMSFISWAHTQSDLFNTLRPRQNGRHFPDDIFKWIFLNENVQVTIDISQKFVPRGPINNIPALVQIMAWRRPGDKPLSEAMMARSTTHICVIRPQWVKSPTKLDTYFMGYTVYKMSSVRGIFHGTQGI